MFLKYKFYILMGMQVKLPRLFYDALKEHCKCHYHKVGQMLRQVEGCTSQSLKVVLFALNQVRDVKMFRVFTVLMLSSASSSIDERDIT